MFLLFLACLIVVGAVVLMARQVEVRLALLGAGLLMALLAGKPLAVLDTFTTAMVAVMVAPICAAMGFAAVLKATDCDRHLVYLLLAPIRRAEWLVLPGGMAAAYVINMVIPSQTSTAAALGPVLLPLLFAAGVRPQKAGAALILGASFGGDLLSPSAQDVQAMAGVTRLSASALSSCVIPASIAGACVAFLVFTLLNRQRRQEDLTEGEAIPPAFYPDAADSAAPFRLNLVKALLPLLPITLLLLASSGWTPLQWLRSVPPGPKWEPFAGALPVVRAMLIGALLMLAVNWREVSQVARSLFDGMGSAYGSIISLTITAQCFGAGLAALGVTDMLVQLLSGKVALARLLAVGFPWGLAVLSGSGSGPILTFAQTFLAPLGDRYDPITLGSLACLAGAFGRTMSPIAAVVVYSSGLVGVSPVLLVRRLLPALLAGAAVALLVALARS